MFENTRRLGRGLFPFTGRGRRVQRPHVQLAVPETGAGGGVGGEGVPEEEVGRERQGQGQGSCTRY